MRTVAVLALALLFILGGCRSSGKRAAVEQLPATLTDQVWDFRDATTWLLGDLTPAMLMNPPHDKWYDNGYAGYQPDEQILAQLMELKHDELSIIVVVGTWCPDSRREVPHFMKIIDLWGFPHENIRFIGVDIDKVAPLEDYMQMGIERVPTFIFYKNKSEKGRIIEVPVTSLEQDTRDILTSVQVY